MRNAWTLTKVRMRLALRNRAFIFFSLVFPLIFLFLFLGLFARSNIVRRPLHAGLRAGHHRDGQLLGLEHSAGHLPRAGYPAPFSGGAGGRGRHARFEHSLELHFDPAHRRHRIHVGAQNLSHAASGAIWEACFCWFPWVSSLSPPLA